MMRSAHLFFAEVSLDISRGECQSAMEKLAPHVELFPESYLFHLLYAKALRGLNQNTQAGNHLRQCCALAPANQVAWGELLALQATANGNGLDDEAPAAYDPVTDELEKLSLALMNFSPVKTTENADPTSILEQKLPFSDDTTIAVPTETLANLFTAQGAYKKAIKIYTHLILLNPATAEHYQHEIDLLLERL